jgi:hypothetical protein
VLLGFETVDDLLVDLVDGRRVCPGLKGLLSPALPESFAEMMDALVSRYSLTEVLEDGRAETFVISSLARSCGNSPGECRACTALSPSGC